MSSGGINDMIQADEATLADKQTQLKLEGKALLKVQLPNSKDEWTTGYVWVK